MEFTMTNPMPQAGWSPADLRSWIEILLSSVDGWFPGPALEALINRMEVSP
jgi:hypothetical protein